MKKVKGKEFDYVVIKIKLEEWKFKMIDNDGGGVTILTPAGKPVSFKTSVGMTKWMKSYLAAEKARILKAISIVNAANNILKKRRDELAVTNREIDEVCR